MRAHPAGEESSQDNGVTDPEGARWRRTTSSINPRQAHALAVQGARLAWDPCGCGGYCAFTWFDAADVARLVAAGPPRARRTKTRRANISEWVGDDGRSLVVAEDAIRWADLLD